MITMDEEQRQFIARVMGRSFEEVAEAMNAILNMASIVGEQLSIAFRNIHRAHIPRVHKKTMCQAPQKLLQRAWRK